MVFGVRALAVCVNCLYLTPIRFQDCLQNLKFRYEKHTSIR
jgi:hypothetical protein